MNKKIYVLLMAICLILFVSGCTTPTENSCPKCVNKLCPVISNTLDFDNLETGVFYQYNTLDKSIRPLTQLEYFGIVYANQTDEGVTNYLKENIPIRNYIDFISKEYEGDNVSTSIYFINGTLVYSIANTLENVNYLK